MEQLTYNWSGVRIDHYLPTVFPYTRSFFHHILERWGVLVNDKAVKKSYKLKDGDVVMIESLERFLDGGILEESPEIELDIRLEKDDYLVLYKPKGVLSHPNSIRDVSQPNVVWWLYHHFSELPSTASFIRAGLIHRLDKDTDGLMIIAKTEQWLAHFKELFQRKSLATSIKEKEEVPLHKFYKASCQLSLLWETFLEDIQTPFYIDEPVKAKVPHPGEPKRGITKILGIHQQLWWEAETVDLELEILTGRTHQIRYHLSNHGLPIVGDYLYGLEAEIPMQLTAWKLMFEDTEGEQITLEA